MKNYWVKWFAAIYYILIQRGRCTIRRGGVFTGGFAFILKNDGFLIMVDLKNSTSLTGKPFVLGLDIGSVAVSVVEMSLEGEFLRTHYAFHHGDIYKTLCSLLEGIEFPLLSGIACITAAKHNHQNVGSLLSVGGEKFSLITFDSEGNYQNLGTNTSCAAGTGSFLDQQARRLNLSGSAELSRLALQNKNIPPTIASRCSVFANAINRCQVIYFYHIKKMRVRKLRSYLDKKFANH
jgi:hypothetical protein